MAKKQTDPVSFREGYLTALDDCEQLLRELGFNDAKEIMDGLRRKLPKPEELEREE